MRPYTVFGYRLLLTDKHTKKNRSISYFFFNFLNEANVFVFFLIQNLQRLVGSQINYRLNTTNKINFVLKIGKKYKLARTEPFLELLNKGG